MASDLKFFICLGFGRYQAHPTGVR